MPVPIARKRLKKKMLDRWENEGGRIAPDTISADASRPTGEDKGGGDALRFARACPWLSHCAPSALSFDFWCNAPAIVLIDQAADHGKLA